MIDQVWFVSIKQSFHAGGIVDVTQIGDQLYLMVVSAFAKFYFNVVQRGLRLVAEQDTCRGQAIEHAHQFTSDGASRTRY